MTAPDPSKPHDPHCARRVHNAAPCDCSKAQEGANGEKEKRDPLAGRYRVGKFLDASTDHLTEDDLMILEQHQEEHGDVDRDVTLPRIIPHRYGWWINVQWQDTEQCVKDRAAFKERMSLGFRKLFTRAVDEECDWINLDRDA